MNITESRDEAFEGNSRDADECSKKDSFKLAADYCVSDKTVYKWITRV